ncbi:hypothetical protein HHK36_025169 [Tetracentron sinense]|uniref:Uncharacterized protein n=1 Tax=Tetracentron sinense TaxID=13715 RepID=A0A834YLL9_TETSI|nr:hypothetical protein HHK36_025169 [Tetracentron sinense]
MFCWGHCQVKSEVSKLEQKFSFRICAFSTDFIISIVCGVLTAHKSSMATSLHKTSAYPQQSCFLWQEKDTNQIEPPRARFQRTDQWIPIYSWLESLDKHEVVKSKDISDWLSENPSVKEQLFSRHSRYHLMHYIKKCHLKVLKRRAKQKQPNTKAPMKVHYNRVTEQRVQQSNTTAPMKVHYNGVTEQCVQQSNTTAPMKVHNKVATTLPVPLPWNSSSNLCKDNDIYIARRNEAFLKYELLTDLENQLSSLLSKHKQVNNLKESDLPSLP